jgi:hypothetical protein
MVGVSSAIRTVARNRLRVFETDFWPVWLCVVQFRMPCSCDCHDETSGPYFTVRRIVVVCCNEPEVPLTVMV